MAISNEDDCEPANDQTGSSGDCGSAVAGVSYMISYLVLSFLIIVNMYIAVILENYSQVSSNEPLVGIYFIPIYLYLYISFILNRL